MWGCWECAKYGFYSLSAFVARGLTDTAHASGAFSSHSIRLLVRDLIDNRNVFVFLLNLNTIAVTN